MEKTLDIIVTHYNEIEDVYKPLFDSIALQQCIDFARIRVIVVNDGSLVTIPLEFFQQYRYDINYYEIEHGGISVARNFGLEKSDAEYVMFCDCDDLFCSVFGILYIFNEIRKGEFDTFNPDFIEECHDAKGNVKFATHHEDHTFIHGKVFRREWLTRNKLRFNPNCQFHEDALFNALVLQLSTDSGARTSRNPYYLWKWRKGSVCRSEPDFVLRTYYMLIKCRKLLIEDLRNRGYYPQANFYASMMILDGYFQSNTPAWKKEENAGYRAKAFELLADFWRGYKDMIHDVSPQEMAIITNKSRERAINEGMVTEDYTFAEFIKTLEG